MDEKQAANTGRNSDQQPLTQSPSIPPIDLVRSKDNGILADAQKDKSANKEDGAYSHVLKGIKIAEIFMIVLNILIVVFMFFQWRVTSDQLKEMKSDSLQADKHLQIEDRAWIYVKQPIQYDHVINERINCTLDFINDGKTPAKKCMGLGDIWIDNPNLSGDEIVGHVGAIQNPNGTTPIDLAPDQGMQMVIHSFAAVTKETNGEVTAGKKWVYLAGRFSYLDYFGETHFTTFCYRMIEIDAKSGIGQAYGDYNEIE